MDFGDQRAGRIEDGKPTCLRFLRNGATDPVRTEDQGGTGRDIVQVFDEKSALFFQRFDHKGVVHDFMPNIDWWAEFGQGLFDDVDGTINPCAKSPGFG